MEYPKYNERISLIPGGCPQILDFCVDMHNFERMRRSFEERVEKDAQGNPQTRLFPLITIDGEEVDVFDHKTSDGEHFSLDLKRCIQPWLDTWFPIPFLREREQVWEDTGIKRVDAGPSNWARARMVLHEDTLALVLAFDMQVEPVKGDQVYGALSPEDVNAHAQFRLAWDIRDCGWFVNEPWVDGWLKDVWKTNSTRRAREDAPVLEYLASYLLILEFLHTAINDAKVYVINPSKLIPIDVDFVLDIGNSRTTGILVETQAQRVTNLNNSYLLQLRDMDAPENIYTDPFETRIEFSEVSFGNEAFSRRSGRRSQAFVWPSPVRIGPEAQRLSTQSACAEGQTGMSSPKRYLWDERDWKQSWRFNTKGNGEPYVTRGLLAQQVNSSGTPLCCMQDARFRNNRILRKQEQESAFESLFTRSSLMLFLFVEVISQALLTINSPGQRIRRAQPDIPRRLRQVIFTVPAGMPLAEQRIYRRWADWAVKVLWETLGWKASFRESPKKWSKDLMQEYRRSPLVRCNWDEATCTQLVYIYNEISVKFQGDAQLFCSLVGSLREQYQNHPCLRVATIDIGGGTTDLSITTFELQSDAGSSVRMKPHPEFHDGFSLAGDDVLCAVVRDHVLAAIGAAMADAGIPDTTRALGELFGRDVIDSSEESRNQRTQFVRQVAVPIALTLLAAYETCDLTAGSGRISARIGDCFSVSALTAKPFPMPNRAALRYVDDYLARHGVQERSVLDMPIVMDPKQIDETIRGVLKDIMANLCEVIHRMDCDALLLTGRPSSWKAIQDLVTQMLPVAPGRIYPMSTYRVGTWYPFADALGTVTDPKTTVVVGAILCTLAEGQLEGFSFDPKTLRLHSTAKYIGEMEVNGQIKIPKVWFDVDVSAKEEVTYTHKITFGSPIAVGFRQLPVERWTTTRFYILEFANEDVRNTYAHALPFQVTLELRVLGFEDEEYDDVREVSERDEGEFSIVEVLDRDERAIPNVLVMRLQTLPRDEGFWLDTGIVY